MAKEKVVLAYSGGLDTSIIIPWLKENYDYDVIAVCGDVGQGKETDGLEERAKKAGASKLYIEDLRDDYVKDYIFPTLKAGAVYEGKYLLGTSHARPIIAKRLVEIYPLGGKFHIAHGVSNAILFAHVMEFNKDACQDRLAALCDAVYPTYAEKSVEEKADYIISQIADIVKVTNIPTDLTQYGVTMNDLDFLVTAGSQQQRLLVNNMKELSLDDIRNIYLKVVK